MNVPGDFVEDRNERVDCNEADTGFDQTAGKQATLAEAGYPVALANFLRLIGKVESFAGFFAGHQPISGSEIGVHELGTRARFEVFDDVVNDFAEFAAALETGFSNLRRREEIGNFELLLRWIGVQHEWVVRFAEKTGILSVRHVAAGWSHRFWQTDVGGKFIAAAFKKFQSATSMGCVDAASEESAGLHHLMPGIVDRCGSMITGPDEREFVSQFRDRGKDFRNLDVRIVGLDWLERPAD